MAKYSEEFREQTVRKVMPPNAMSVARISRDSGISEQIRKLEKELRRKEKALAETAVLLVLQKKAQAIWGTARTTDRPRGPSDGD